MVAGLVATTSVVFAGRCFSTSSYRHDLVPVIVALLHIIFVSHIIVSINIFVLVIISAISVSLTKSVGICVRASTHQHFRDGPKEEKGF